MRLEAVLALVATHAPALQQQAPEDAQWEGTLTLSDVPKARVKRVYNRKAAPPVKDPTLKGSVSQQLAGKPITAEERKAANLLRADQIPDPVAQLEEVSQIILASIAKDGWDAEGNRAVLISAKRKFDHNYLQSYLKQKHGLQFSNMAIGLDMAQLASSEGAVDSQTHKSWRITLSK